MTMWSAVPYVVLVNTSYSRLSRSLTVDFILFSLFILFYLFSSFLFIFLFLEQSGLGFVSHAVTSVTNWWHSYKTDYETWKNKVEGSRTKWYHTAWTTHAGLIVKIVDGGLYFIFPFYFYFLFFFSFSFLIFYF